MSASVVTPYVTLSQILLEETAKQRYPSYKSLGVTLAAPWDNGGCCKARRDKLSNAHQKIRSLQGQPFEAPPLDHPLRLVHITKGI